MSDPWTREEDEALADGYPVHGATWRGWELLLPNRTEGAIRAHANVIGVRYDGPTRSHPEEHGMEMDETAIASLGEWDRERLRILVQTANVWDRWW